MRVLVNGKKIERAQQEFMKLVSSNSTKHRMRIGDPGGHRENALVYWIGCVDLWANFEKPLEPGERYWNLFGLGKPDSVARTMCEINLPTRGINRRLSGAFARSGEDLCILHRGHFNAYRGRIPMDYVYANFKGTWISVGDGDRDSKLLSVGKLSDTEFLYDLRDFVQAVTKLKETYKHTR